MFTTLSKGHTTRATAVSVWDRTTGLCLATAQDESGTVAYIEPNLIVRWNAYDDVTVFRYSNGELTTASDVDELPAWSLLTDPAIEPTVFVNDLHGRPACLDCTSDRFVPLTPGTIVSPPLLELGISLIDPNRDDLSLHCPGVEHDAGRYHYWIHPALSDLESALVCFDICPEFRFAALTVSGLGFHVFDVVEERVRWQCDDEPKLAKFIDGGDKLLAVLADGRLRIYDAETGDTTQTVVIPTTQKLNPFKLRSAPDGGNLLEFMTSNSKPVVTTIPYSPASKFSQQVILAILYLVWAIWLSFTIHRRFLVANWKVVSLVLAIPFIWLSIELRDDFYEPLRVAWGIRTALADLLIGLLIAAAWLLPKHRKVAIALGGAVSISFLVGANWPVFRNLSIIAVDTLMTHPLGERVINAVMWLSDEAVSKILSLCSISEILIADLVWFGLMFSGACAIVRMGGRKRLTIKPLNHVDVASNEKNRGTAIGLLLLLAVTLASGHTVAMIVSVTSYIFLRSKSLAIACRNLLMFTPFIVVARSLAVFSKYEGAEFNIANSLQESVVCDGFALIACALVIFCLRRFGYHVELDESPVQPSRGGTGNSAETSFAKA